ncbi:MAG: preprotein translocase subunit YajC [Collinsella sp.]|nr:preprotein translocase subunit YajC [Collinsella sp.]
MADFGANILASSVALLILLAIMGVVYVLWSMSGIKKKQKYFEQIHTTIAPGQKVMFGGGIYGTIKKVDGDVVQVEVRSGAILDVSRYAIQEIDK